MLFFCDKVLISNPSLCERLRLKPISFEGGKNRFFSVSRTALTGLDTNAPKPGMITHSWVNNRFDICWATVVIPAKLTKTSMRELTFFQHLLVSC